LFIVLKMCCKMCLFSEFKDSGLFAKLLCKNGELDELINKSYGVVSVIVAIIIRANNGKVLSP